MDDDSKKYWFSEVTIDWSTLGLRIPREISETLKIQNPLMLAGERMRIAEKRAKAELDVCIKDFIDGEEDPVMQKYEEVFPEAEGTKKTFVSTVHFKNSNQIGPYALTISYDDAKNLSFKVESLAMESPSLIGEYTLAGKTLFSSIKDYEEQIRYRKENVDQSIDFYRDASHFRKEEIERAQSYAKFLAGLEEADIRRSAFHNIGAEIILMELNLKQGFKIERWEKPGAYTDLNKSSLCRFYSILYMLRPIKQNTRPLSVPSA